MSASFTFHPDRPLHILAIDTSTDTLSLAVGIWPAGSALTGAPAQIWQHMGAGAAQSSGTLIPAAFTLLNQAQLTVSALDVIAFGAGPGSFTGLRTACSVAQGLALGAHLPVLPVSTLLCVAEDWRLRYAASRNISEQTVWSLLDARMDEVYLAAWRWKPLLHNHHRISHWQAIGQPWLCKPEHISHAPGFTPDAVCAGNVQDIYGSRLPVMVPSARPCATAMLHLAPALLQSGAAIDPALALPQYVRNKVAQTTAEREAARLAQTQPSGQ